MPYVFYNKPCVFSEVLKRGEKVGNMQRKKGCESFFFGCVTRGFGYAVEEKKWEVFRKGIGTEEDIKNLAGVNVDSGEILSTIIL